MVLPTKPTVKASELNKTDDTVKPKIVNTEAKPINPVRVKDTEAQYNWTVIGLEDCEFTKQAVSLLKTHNETYKYIPLNAEWHRRIIVEHGTRRIPAIFRGSSYFGCLHELEGYYKCSFVADSERF